MVDLNEAIFYSIPLQVSLSLAILLLYWYLRDKNERKLFFAVGAAVGALGNFYLMLYRFSLMPFFEPAEWLFAPLAIAFPIVAFSNLREPKNFAKPLTVFASGTTASILIFILQVSLDRFQFAVMAFLMILSVPTLFYAVFKNRETSDIIFLIATLCFIFQLVTTEAGSPLEISILLNLFGGILTGLLFTVPPGHKRGLAAFSLLKRQRALELIIQTLTTTVRDA